MELKEYKEIISKMNKILTSCIYLPSKELKLELAIICNEILFKTRYHLKEVNFQTKFKSSFYNQIGINIFNFIKEDLFKEDKLISYES